MPKKRKTNRKKILELELAKLRTLVELNQRLVEETRTRMNILDQLFAQQKDAVARGRKHK